MGRGNRHGAIYKTEEDYCFFLRILKEIQDRNPFDLHAVCLMTNHFHLVDKAMPLSQPFELRSLEMRAGEKDM